MEQGVIKMFSTKSVKLKATLFLTSALVGMMVFPEAGYASAAATRRILAERQAALQKEQELKALNEKVHGVAGAPGAPGGLMGYKNALADPAAKLGAAGAGTLTAAVTAASGDAHSAAHHMSHATNEDKIAAMRAIEGGGAGDARHKAAIRTALGLDPNAPASNADVAAFITKAGDQIYINAVATPLPQLDPVRPLGAALAHAAGVPGSAAQGVPAPAHGAPADQITEYRIALLNAIETANLHVVGGNADDDAAKIAIRKALGLPLDPAQSRVNITAFLRSAEGAAIGVRLAGIGGLGASTIERLEDVRRRLEAGDHRAGAIGGAAGANIGAGPANETIAAALTRLGL
jgi:hypothetical protein